MKLGQWRGNKRTRLQNKGRFLSQKANASFHLELFPCCITYMSLLKSFPGIQASMKINSYLTVHLRNFLMYSFLMFQQHVYSLLRLPSSFYYVYQHFTMYCEYFSSSSVFLFNLKFNLISKLTPEEFLCVSVTICLELSCILQHFCFTIHFNIQLTWNLF